MWDGLDYIRSFAKHGGVSGGEKRMATAYPAFEGNGYEP